MATAEAPPDASHPLGDGRDAYVWSMIAAFGLFAVGAAVSIMRGIQQLVAPEEDEELTISYVVLGSAFVLESVSFAQAFRQAHRESSSRDRDLLSFVPHTSDPTVRAVFFEDAAALIGRDRVPRHPLGPAHRVADAGRHRLDPGRRPARHRRGRAHPAGPQAPGRGGR